MREENTNWVEKIAELKKTYASFAALANDKKRLAECHAQFLLTLKAEAQRYINSTPVAESTANKIVNGLGSFLFSAEKFNTAQEIIELIARTLRDEGKGLDNSTAELFVELGFREGDWEIVKYYARPSQLIEKYCQVQDYKNAIAEYKKLVQKTNIATLNQEEKQLVTKILAIYEKLPGQTIWSNESLSMTCLKAYFENGLFLALNSEEQLAFIKKAITKCKEEQDKFSELIFLFLVLQCGGETEKFGIQELQTLLQNSFYVEVLVRNAGLTQLLLRYRDKFSNPQLAIQAKEQFEHIYRRLTEQNSVRPSTGMIALLEEKEENTAQNRQYLLNLLLLHFLNCDTADVATLIQQDQIEALYKRCETRQEQKHFLTSLKSIIEKRENNDAILNVVVLAITNIMCWQGITEHEIINVFFQYRDKKWAQQALRDKKFQSAVLLVANEALQQIVTHSATPFPDPSLLLSMLPTPAVLAKEAFLNGKYSDAIYYLDEAVKNPQHFVLPDRKVWLLELIGGYLKLPNKENVALLKRAITEVKNPKDTAFLTSCLEQVAKDAMFVTENPIVHYYLAKVQDKLNLNEEAILGLLATLPENEKKWAAALITQITDISSYSAATLLQLGDVVGADTSQTLRFYCAAAEKANGPVGNYTLGQLYHKVAQIAARENNITLALTYYAKAAELNEQMAMQELITLAEKNPVQLKENAETRQFLTTLMTTSPRVALMLAKIYKDEQNYLLFAEACQTVLNHAAASVEQKEQTLALIVTVSPRDIADVLRNEALLASLIKIGEETPEKLVKAMFLAMSLNSIKNNAVAKRLQTLIYLACGKVDEAVQTFKELASNKNNPQDKLLLQRLADAHIHSKQNTSSNIFGDDSTEETEEFLRESCQAFQLNEQAKRLKKSESITEVAQTLPPIKRKLTINQLSDPESSDAENTIESPRRVPQQIKSKTQDYFDQQLEQTSRVVSVPQENKKEEAAVKSRIIGDFFGFSEDTTPEKVTPRSSQNSENIFSVTKEIVELKSAVIPQSSRKKSSAAENDFEEMLSLLSQKSEESDEETNAFIELNKTTSTNIEKPKVETPKKQTEAAIPLSLTGFVRKTVEQNILQDKVATTQNSSHSVVRTHNTNTSITTEQTIVKEQTKSSAQVISEKSKKQLFAEEVKPPVMPQPQKTEIKQAVVTEKPKEKPVVNVSAKKNEITTKPAHVGTTKKNIQENAHPAALKISHDLSADALEGRTGVWLFFANIGQAFKNGYEWLDEKWNLFVMGVTDLFTSTWLALNKPEKLSDEEWWMNKDGTIKSLQSRRRKKVAVEEEDWMPTTVHKMRIIQAPSSKASQNMQRQLQEAESWAKKVCEERLGQTYGKNAGPSFFAKTEKLSSAVSKEFLQPFSEKEQRYIDLVLVHSKDKYLTRAVQDLQHCTASNFSSRAVPFK